MSSCNSRFTSHAMLDSCSMVTATFPTDTGALSFSPLRMPGDEVREMRIGHRVAPDRSADEVVFPVLNSLVFFPFRS